MTTTPLTPENATNEQFASTFRGITQKRQRRFAWSLDRQAANQNTARGSGVGPTSGGGGPGPSGGGGGPSGSTGAGVEPGGGPGPSGGGGGPSGSTGAGVEPGGGGGPGPSGGGGGPSGSTGAGVEPSGGGGGPTSTTSASFSGRIGQETGGGIIVVEQSPVASTSNYSGLPVQSQTVGGGVSGLSSTQSPSSSVGQIVIAALLASIGVGFVLSVPKARKVLL